MTTDIERAREARLRRLAHRYGLRLVKSRCRKPHYNDQGGFQLVEVYTNTVLNGVNYELGLSEVEYWLEPDNARRLRGQRERCTLTEHVLGVRAG